MMETQAKLSDMEEKIKCLGLDTSLIQSMA